MTNITKEEIERLLEIASYQIVPLDRYPDAQDERIRSLLRVIIEHAEAVALLVNE